MPDPGEALACSFCGTGQKQVEKLICVPPHVYICDRCVGRAHAVLAAPGHAISTPIATIGLVSAESGAQRCGFCGKRRDQVAAMASAGHPHIICDECLDLCDEILAEEPPAPRP